MSMILDGANIRSQSGGGVSQAALSTAQLLCTTLIALSVEEMEVLLFITTKPEKPHWPSMWDSRSMQWHGSVDLWTDCFNLVCPFPTTGWWRSPHATMGNRVCEQYHRDQSVCPTYDRDCSLQQRLITLITTPAQQPPVIHSTVLESHYSNTPPLRTVGRIVGNDGKVFPKALDEEFE